MSFQEADDARAIASVLSANSGAASEQTGQSVVGPDVSRLVSSEAPVLQSQTLPGLWDGVSPVYGLML